MDVVRTAEETCNGYDYFMLNMLGYEPCEEGSSRDKRYGELVSLKSMEYMILFFGSMGTLTGSKWNVMVFCNLARVIEDSTRKRVALGAY